MITYQQHWANAKKNRVYDETLTLRERDLEFAKFINRTGNEFNNNAIILEPNEKVINVERVMELLEQIEYESADSVIEVIGWNELKKELGL